MRGQGPPAVSTSSYVPLWSAVMKRGDYTPRSRSLRRQALMKNRPRPYTGCMSLSGPNGRAFRVDRGYVEVSGPDAADYLERMLSNEVATLEPGGRKSAR